MSFGDTDISFSNIAYIIDGREPGPGTAISLSSFRGKMDIPSSGPISIQTYFKGKTYVQQLTIPIIIMIKVLDLWNQNNSTGRYFNFKKGDLFTDFYHIFIDDTNTVPYNGMNIVARQMRGGVEIWSGSVVMWDSLGDTYDGDNTVVTASGRRNNWNNYSFKINDELLITLYNSTPLINEHNYGLIGTSTSLYNYIGKRKIQNDDDSATYSWVAVEKDTRNIQSSSNYVADFIADYATETISYSFDTKIWASEITIIINYRDENNEEKTLHKGFSREEEDAHIAPGYKKGSLSNDISWNGTLSVYPNSTVTVNGYDSYGDGWHGAYLTITYDGNQIEERRTISTGKTMTPIEFTVGGNFKVGGFYNDLQGNYNYRHTTVSNLISFRNTEDDNIVVFENNTNLYSISLYTDIIFGGYNYNNNREHIGVEFTVSEKVAPTFMTLHKLDSKNVHIDEIPFVQSWNNRFGFPVGSDFYSVTTFILGASANNANTFEMSLMLGSSNSIKPSVESIGTSSRSIFEPGDSVRMTIDKNTQSNNNYCDIIIWSRSYENSVWVKNHIYTTTLVYENTYWSSSLSTAPGLLKFNKGEEAEKDYKIKNYQLIDRADDVKGEWVYFEFDEEVFLSKLIMGNINVWQRQVKIISLVASDEPDAQTSNFAVLTHFEGYPSDDNGDYDENNKEYMTFDFERYISTIKYKRKWKYWGLIIENLKIGGQLNIRYIQFFKENLFTLTLPLDTWWGKWNWLGDVTSTTGFGYIPQDTNWIEITFQLKVTISSGYSNYFHPGILFSQDGDVNSYSANGANVHGKSNYIVYAMDKLYVRQGAIYHTGSTSREEFDYGISGDGTSNMGTRYHNVSIQIDNVSRKLNMSIVDSENSNNSLSINDESFPSSTNDFYGRVGIQCYDKGNIMYHKDFRIRYGTWSGDIVSDLYYNGMSSARQISGDGATIVDNMLIDDTKITVKDWSTQYNSSYTPSNVLLDTDSIWKNGNSKEGNSYSRESYNENGYYSDPLKHKLNIIGNL